jgi:hypothetical protein
MAITDVRVITKDGIQLIHLNHNTQGITNPDFWAAWSLSGPALLARQLVFILIHNFFYLLIMYHETMSAAFVVNGFKFIIYD